MWPPQAACNMALSAVGQVSSYLALRFSLCRRVRLLRRPVTSRVMKCDEPDHHTRLRQANQQLLLIVSLFHYFPKHRVSYSDGVSIDCPSETPRKGNTSTAPKPRVDGRTMLHESFSQVVLSTYSSWKRRSKLPYNTGSQPRLVAQPPSTQDLENHIHPPMYDRYVTNGRCLESAEKKICTQEGEEKK